jgi:hypothetical protein
MTTNMLAPLQLPGLPAGLHGRPPADIPPFWSGQAGWDGFTDSGCDDRSTPADRPWRTSPAVPAE